MLHATADFETNNSETECRVWSWGFHVVGNDEYYSGTTIESFIEYIKELSYENEKLTIWFHNLKFDGSFICNFLLSNGYCHVKDRKFLKPNTFTSLISDMGVWYTLTIAFGNGTEYGEVVINDSLKILPYSVANVAKSFGLEESKGTIDYDFIRPVGYIPTAEEEEYQRTDCRIMALALKYMFERNLTRITAGSNALQWYKHNVKKKEWEKWFPKIAYDEFIRKSYRGGWTYADPRFRGKLQGKGIVLDVNSLYPSRLRYCLLPYGEGTYYEGKYKEDKYHPLYVQKLECVFELKKGKLPTIQLKGAMKYTNAEYATSSHGEVVELTLTNVDLGLFLEHYKVTRLTYIEGYKFKGQTGMFDEYIDYWMHEKIDCEKRGDKAGRTLAKLFMNSLYGKFAKRPNGRQKYPYLKNEILHFETGDLEEQDTLYIPIGTFTTAYARDVTIRAAQAEYKRFMYADTDSLHLKGLKSPENIEVDAYKLGAWKHESTFKRAIYIGAKCYVEEEIHTANEIDKYLEENPEDETLVNRKQGTILKVTCAGMPAKMHKEVTIDNFAVGLRIDGKLTGKQVKGGCMLVRSTFEIKKRVYENSS